MCRVGGRPPTAILLEGLLQCCQCEQAFFEFAINVSVIEHALAFVAPYAATSRMDGGTKSYHLYGVALLPATRALDVVHLTLVVHVSKGAGRVVHCAEVVEETPQGIQGVQVVASFHIAIVICA